jgi:hypothetical protein
MLLFTSRKTIITFGSSQTPENHAELKVPKDSIKILYR